MSDFCALDAHWMLSTDVDPSKKTQMCPNTNVFNLRLCEQTVFLILELQKGDK